MRILYYHQHFSTPHGAAGTRSYVMARHLIEAGHQVTMVCGSNAICDTGIEKPFRKGKRVGRVDGIDVIELALPYTNQDSLLRRSFTFLRFAWKSVIIALTSTYDVLFATSTPLTAGIPGIFAHSLRRKPFIFEVRDLWPELPREMGVIRNRIVLRALDILEWLTYHAADRCIGLSPGIVEGIQRRGISADRTAMIPNGCDVELFHPGAQVERQAQSTGLTAIFTGAHGIANGLDALLDSAAELLALGREDIQIILIGDGKQKPQLMERAKREQLTNCRFLDSVPKLDLARQLHTADVGLMILANVPAFYYGTSPNKFFDYIAAGLPVINNYPGWLAELISEHQCGIAVEPDQPAALAEALMKLADSPAQRQLMGHNARRLAESTFNRARLADQFVEQFMSLGS